MSTDKNCKDCIHLEACSKWTDFPKQIGFPVCMKFETASDVAREIFNWLEAHFVNLNFVSGNVELNFGDYLRFKTNILMKYTEDE